MIDLQMYGFEQSSAWAYPITWWHKLISQKKQLL